MNREKSISIPQSFLDEIIAEAKVDEVGLWFIIARIRDDLGVNDPLVLRETALQCVSELLASGEIVAGYYNPDGSGIDAWKTDPESIVSRINVEWDGLGREPNIGDIVVFVGSAN